MPFSYWVRQTSNTAQADTLVIGNEPAVQLTLTDDSPFIPGVDSAGDLLLEGGGTTTTFGTMDPDTWAIVGGTTYRVVYDAVATLPFDNKVPVSLRGDPVYVIRLYSLTNPPVLFRSYFFSPESATNIAGSQAVMNGFGNGNLRLGAVLNPPPVYVCFCAGTLIATPSGQRSVESLRAGDFVLNDADEAHQIIWAGVSRVPLDHLRKNPTDAPIRIAKDAFGPSRPAADLMVSPQHRIVLEGPTVELLFGSPRVLAAARHLVGTFAEHVVPEASLDYFHILTESHEILMSNDLPSESFQPARRSIEVMTPKVRTVLEDVLAALGREDMLERQDALPSLKGYEVRLLAEMMTALPIVDQERTSPVAAMRD
jgi:hypothetical protein